MWIYLMSIEIAYCQRKLLAVSWNHLSYSITYCQIQLLAVKWHDLISKGSTCCCLVKHMFYQLLFIRIGCWIIKRWKVMSNMPLWKISTFLTFFSHNVNMPQFRYSHIWPYQTHNTGLTLYFAYEGHSYCCSTQR